VVTLTYFPRLLAPTELESESQTCQTYIPYSLVNSSERISTIMGSMLARRGGNSTTVRVPAFRDQRTNLDQTPHIINGSIVGYGMPFGPSHCGLQVTIQAKNLQEARYLHDQLIPLGPILMALTAATPFFRGFLADVDCRWTRLNQAIDDRTPDEINAGRLHPRWAPNQFYLSKSTFQDETKESAAEGSDTERRLQQGEMDYLLSKHFATILDRAPVALTPSDLQNLESDDINLFDILHSCTYPHVDLKIPSDDGNLGWRLEFRPMEVQPSDFENAAFVIFVQLLARTILHLNLDLYMPIETVKENMDRAHTRDAVNREHFHFRHNIQARNVDTRDDYILMTLDEIMNGCKDLSFLGLVPFVRSYIHEIYVNEPEQHKVQLSKYLDLVSARANGTSLTPATWMRKFVTGHKDYQSDSVVSESVCYDLIKVIDRHSRQGVTVEQSSTL
jgi:glutamate--cysteine ligase catalytic subunit